MYKKLNIISGIKMWWERMTTKESPQSLTSAQKTGNNSRSLQIERIVINGSPFTIVGTEKNGYWLTMGKHRITEPYTTKKEVRKKLNKLDWTIVTAMIIAFVHDRKLVDEAYSKNTDEKSQQMATDLNN